MIKTDIYGLLAESRNKSTQPGYRPTAEDFEKIQAAFSCRLPQDFVDFYSVLADFQYDAGLLNISALQSYNGNEDILQVYKQELEHGDWLEWLIPFWAIGNGDYYCLSNRAEDFGKIYYYCQDNSSESMEYETFSDFLWENKEFI